MMAALVLSIVAAPRIEAWGQADAGQRRLVRSSGLDASIGIINLPQAGEIEVPLSLTNSTKQRMYLFITGDNRATLSDGHSLRLKEVVGVTYCKLLYPPEKVAQLCMEQHGNDVNYYSYIEPGDSSHISFQYSMDHVPQGYTASGAINFRAIAIIRNAFAVPNSLEVRANPGNITPPQVVILNFPAWPLAGP
ncbi:MAG: hypothetical protein INR65_08140 [Gluconacetobacter diazotrophicus]|nr:hypothetical protein [Gluconacetobacter diazotrophicus]